MFGGRKKDKPKRPAPARPGPRGGNLSQFGLFDVPGVDEFGNVNDALDEDVDLEKELQMLMNDGSGAEKKAKAKPKGVDPAHLQTMVAECMKDVASDDEEEDEDEDLLNELATFEGEDNNDDVVMSHVPKVSHPEPVTAPPVIVEPMGTKSLRPRSPCGSSCLGQDLLITLDERIKNYSEAETRARETGEAAKCRRFARGLGTLSQLRRKVEAGKAVDPDDIPPPVSISALKNVPSSPPPSASVPDLMDMHPDSTTTHILSEKDSSSMADELPTRNDQLVPPTMNRNPASSPDMAFTQDSAEDEVLQAVKNRREEAKYMALAAKKAGNKVEAMNALKIVKECDSLETIVKGGDQIPMALIPSLPERVELEVQTEGTPVPVETAPMGAERQFSRDDPIQLPANPDDMPPPDPAQFGAPPPPKTVEEGLTQRLDKYRADEAKAKEDANASKARRLGRICKQYEDALRQHKAGKPIPVEDLPTPLGFAPIPIPNTGPAPVPGADSPVVSDSKAKPHPSAEIVQGLPQGQPATRKSGSSLRDKQVQHLELRQAQFKKAALEAKKSGQIEQAKEYLRQAKGFDKVIEASKCGLPVDMSTLPIPPQGQSAATMDFEIVSKEECQPQDLSGDRQEMYSKLEKDLISQVKMCNANRQHFKSTADIASANKFEQMMEHTKKDLDALRYAFKRGDPVPRFHYEVRSFSKIVCNTDLSEQDLEFSVIQGINYSVPNPKEIWTYCKMEFPYPKEKPFLDKTVVVKETNNPEYQHKAIIQVNPKDKSYQRVFKRHNAKVEVWSKGGFLRSDTLIGTAQIKLQPLENHCEIHDGFVLMDGRKVIGGKVEVKIRIRHPIVSKQIEKAQEKWLVIAF